jgi:hypothetical protein
MLFISTVLDPVVSMKSQMLLKFNVCVALHIYSYYNDSIPGMRDK